MNQLRITLFQMDIAWENKSDNLRRLREQLEQLRGTTEIVVLPEMFSTGFSMHPETLAEANGEDTLCTLRCWAAEYGVALAGSFMARESDACYNRAFFLTPEGEAVYYDKRHLFRMGGEHLAYRAGASRPIVYYRGWRLLLLVCYDLRFPVWSRCRHNEYDAVIYVANWPAARRRAWDVLLTARAIENLCYVVGVNRVGSDAHGVTHNGGSCFIDFKGVPFATATEQGQSALNDNEEGTATATLSLDALTRFREKFPAHLDADEFQLTATRR